MPFLNKSTLTYPATNAFPNGIWKDKRDPTSADFKSFSIGTIWINFAAMRGWLMVDRTATSGTWIQMASTGTGILKETGNSGGAVGPDGSSNINVVGSGAVSVVGNPGTNTLTVSVSGIVADSFPTDSGTATPSAGVLNINGAGGTNTSGSGNTVTITSGPTVPTSFVTDAGTATPALNILDIFGGTGINTSGAGHAVTINAAATIATTYNCDSGSATPAANALTVAGGGGTSTTGAGHTITITSTGGGLTWTEILVVGPTAMSVNNGYVSNNAARVQLTLPTLSVFGSILRIVGKGTGGWQINQNAGQSIVLDSSSTSVGVLGTLQSDAFRESVEIVCTTANTVWTIADGIGNYIFN